MSIYVYLYILSFTDRQLFGVVRHVGHLKLGSKPAQLYVRLNIIVLCHQVNHVSWRIIRHYVEAFVLFALPDTRVLYIYIYIYIYNRLIYNPLKFETKN